MPRGKISSSPGNGKLVDTWHYEYQGISDEEGVLRQRVKGIKVPVELRLYKNYKDTEAPPLAVKDVWFTVSCKDPEFKFTGSDIEALRAAMWEKLDSHYEVKWDRHFLVELRPESAYTGIGTGFVLSYDTVYKGLAWDGTLLLRESDRHTYKDKIRPWPGEFTNKRGRVIACIPATKANEAALVEFCKRIDLLREHLASFLRPETIMETLLQLSSLNLLPPIDKEEQ